ncbi:MAG: hypothetical protein E7384_08055 [Ruminococcaceae bacterium]|nr:hypothetical protein [Oscillospiraceae bacterium]
MFKKRFTLILCILMLFCLSSCKHGDDVAGNTSVTSIPDKTDTVLVMESPTSTPTESPTPSTPEATEKTVSAATEKPIAQKSFFNMADITRITFYAYYGASKGSDVPSENMQEIKNWLGTFVIDEKASEMIPPGTNTIKVEIEYADGTVVKKGMDVATVDGERYYLKHDKEPNCYRDILSKVSLE